MFNHLLIHHTCTDLYNKLSFAHTHIAHALPMFRDNQPKSLKRKRELERADPQRSRKPEAPLPGKG